MSDRSQDDRNRRHTSWLIVKICRNCSVNIYLVFSSVDSFSMNVLPHLIAASAIKETLFSTRNITKSTLLSLCKIWELNRIEEKREKKFSFLPKIQSNAKIVLFIALVSLVLVQYIIPLKTKSHQTFLHVYVVYTNMTRWLQSRGQRMSVATDALLWHIALFEPSLPIASTTVLIKIMSRLHRFLHLMCAVFCSVFVRVLFLPFPAKWTSGHAFGLKRSNAY